MLLSIKSRTALAVVGALVASAATVLAGPASETRVARTSSATATWSAASRRLARTVPAQAPGGVYRVDRADDLDWLHAAFGAYLPQ